MIATQAYVIGKLAADSALTALVPSNQMLFNYPNQLSTALPTIIYAEIDQSANTFYDDFPLGFDSVFQFDIYGPYSQSLTPICQAIDTVMESLFYSLLSARPVPEPNNKLNHRSLKYGRILTPADVT